jgi:uncharacterized protein involved in exopolysaccharide biosynthesis
MDPLKVSPPQETKLHFLDYWRIIRIRKTVILAVFLLVVITATLVTFILPESFLSTARIKIERDQSDISGMAERGGLPSYDPYFIQTEFELMTSEVILGKVIEDLDLNKEWGKKYANGDRLKTQETITLLKPRIDLRPVRNTSLIEIRVYSEKADEASKIANAVAEAYKAHRLEQRKNLSNNGIKALEERFAQQEEKVKKAQQQVDAMRVNLNISDAEANAEGPLFLMTGDTLRKLESLRIENKAEYAKQQALLDGLKELRKELGPEGLAQAIPTALPDTLLGVYLQQLGTAEQQLASLSKEYGPEHGEVVKLKSQIEALRSKIKERTDGIMLGQSARVFSLSNGVANFDREVTQATQNDIDAASRTRPYFEAKRNLEELQHFRQILDMKIASEKIDGGLPNTQLVEIVDRAVPPLRPMSPNLPRALAVIVVGILLDIAGLLILNGVPRIVSKPRPA